MKIRDQKSSFIPESNIDSPQESKQHLGVSSCQSELELHTPVRNKQTEVYTVDLLRPQQRLPSGSTEIASAAAAAVWGPAAEPWTEFGIKLEI